MIYYFAYGSNLHPVRLNERVASAELIGVTEYPRHSLKFKKRSNDGSSKCTMLRTGNSSDTIFGAIYRLKPADKKDLDRFEGNGHGYSDQLIELHHQGKQYTCFTYLAQHAYIVDNLKPYHWYKQLVILGARYLKFPDAYISSIETVKSVEDPDLDRQKENEILIETIIKQR